MLRFALFSPPLGIPPPWHKPKTICNRSAALSRSEMSASCGTLKCSVQPRVALCLAIDLQNQVVHTQRRIRILRVVLCDRSSRVKVLTRRSQVSVRLDINDPPEMVPSLGESPKIKAL